ncbi:MAG: hypothetical protein KDI17_08925 [Halioglobus sp.]|jgi:hypothetical protein|nr:hypothetical protein [Halioglobus sp.]
MKRLDEGKTSLVDFLRSIRYGRNHTSKSHDEPAEHFAELNPRARTGTKSNAEEKMLIRSAN